MEEYREGFSVSLKQAAERAVLASSCGRIAFEVSSVVQAASCRASSSRHLAGLDACRSYLSSTIKTSLRYLSFGVFPSWSSQSEVNIKKRPSCETFPRGVDQNPLRAVL